VESLKCVYLESLGCRLNAAEIETLARHFSGAGYLVVDTPEPADVIVMNSCAVTAQAARKSRHRLRTLYRRSPNAQLAVVGCWATEDVERARQLPGVVWAIPNADKARAAEIIIGEDAPPAGAPLADAPLAPWSPGRWGHTRAFLAVQDGCDHVCTYCITRVLRGPARSRPLDDVVNAVHERVAQGAQEVVLTGVSLGAYGQDRGLDFGLATLVKTLLRETAVPRLRLSSIEPWDIDAPLLLQWENPRLCRQLHVPLQSGSDAVLKRMGRHITTAQFAHIVHVARAISHDIAVTTDVIVGFPGETEADYSASLDFVAQMAFARLHVFPYSERTGTAAVRLPNPVPKVVRAERATEMRALGERLAADYRARFIGRTLPVLWEHQDDSGWWRGLSDNYLAVAVQSPADLYNRITPTRLVSFDGGHLVQGEVVAVG
jgi:threonylcarbamoyladenosine tRNA methylthiotransferase MtaB